MEKVKVKTSGLIEVLKGNRQKHVEEYKEAVRQFRMRSVAALKRELEKAINGKKFETNLCMTRPVSHEKDYDLVIKMLELSVDDVTILDQHDFNQFVNDEWSWKPSFSSSTAYYSGSCGTSGYSGVSGTSGTSGTSGFKYVPERTEEAEEVEESYITVVFSGDELYEDAKKAQAGSAGKL
jgi:hypothetical protein